MKELIRQSVGIDVSKDMLDASLSALQDSFQIKIISTASFDNTKKGIASLIQWIARNRIKEMPIQVVLEATGVYHERVTYLLYDRGLDVAVVLPNKIKNYCRSTNVRSITDKISAKQIAEFGLMKKLDNWTKPEPCLRELKSLCRERDQLLSEQTQVKNQRHARDHSEGVVKSTVRRAEKRLKIIAMQIQEVELEIEALIQSNQWLKEKIEYITSIKGLGLITVATIIAETNGFELIRNIPQLVCYAGYDVVQKESGISVRGKSRISHKGNKHIRKALYFPAITAVRHEEFFTNFYDRLFNRQRIKMKSYVAVQRKLLILIYTLWKKEERYDPDKLKGIKFLEQPVKAALTELD